MLLVVVGNGISLNSIEVPLIVSAIGYNRFRDQEEFDPIFNEHIAAMVDKTSFFGLRNTGSINALKKYLPLKKFDVLRRQYCPTNILWQPYPDYRDLNEDYANKLINIDKTDTLITIFKLKN